MKKAKSTEKHIREVYANKLQVTTNSNLDKRVLANSMNVLEKLKNIRSANPQLGIWSTVARSKIAQIAVAAVIIIAIGLFLVEHHPPEQPENHTKTQVAKSPVEMLTAVSLDIAFRKGGMEAVDDQFKKAFKLLEPRPKKLSVQQLLSEFNGNGENQERKNL